MSTNIFSQIQNLKWTPWVGNQYFRTSEENRILIIGESHYHDGTENGVLDAEKNTSTIDVVEEMAIDRCYYQTKIFPNLHRALFRNDDFNSGLFWHLVSFYNFIQRPMHTNLERPTNEDYDQGWKICFQILEVLQPAICLFIGTTASNSFERIALQTNNRYVKIVFEDCISNSYARTGTLITKNGKPIQLIFIRHTAKYFSWDKWNKYLNKKMGSQLETLTKVLQETNDLN